MVCPLGPAVILTARPPERLFHLVFESPWWKGLGAESEEKREPVSDIDPIVVVSLKVFDPVLKLPALALDKSGVVRGARRLAPFGNCGEGAFGATGAKKAEGPPRQRLKAAFEPGQEGEVDEQPHHPAQETRAAEAVEADDRVATGDGSHTAEVVVLEGLGLLTREPPSDGLCSVNAGLQRDLRHAGEVVEVHHVTDDIHLGVTAQRAVGFDLDPARAVEFRARRLR